MNLWKMWKRRWFKRKKINKRGVFCMKKRMILLVLLFGVVSFAKTGVVGTTTRSKNNFSIKKIIFIYSAKNNKSSMMFIEAIKGKKVKLEIENYYI